MIPPFDIFEERDGRPLWRGTAWNLEEAKQTVKSTAASSPGKYLVISQRTGNKTVINTEVQTVPPLSEQE